MDLTNFRRHNTIGLHSAVLALLSIAHPATVSGAEPVQADPVGDLAVKSGSRPGAAAAGRPANRTARENHKPYEMSIGFHINSIDDINWNESTFRADLYWWVLYPWTSDPEIQEKFEALEFTNGEIIEERQTRLQERKRVNNSTYASYRTIARFHFDSNFRKYPFDKQRFLIVMEHEKLPVADLVLRDDLKSYERSGAWADLRRLREAVRISDVEIRRVTRDFSDHKYDTDFGDPRAEPGMRFSRVVLSIEVERQFVPYLVKIVIPLLIILLLAYLVFFLPARELDVAAGLTVTSVLACIAVQFTLSDEMPDVGYIITSDHIFHLCYFLIMLAMAETVFTFNLEKKGRVALSRRIELTARIIFPVAFVIGMTLIIADGFTGKPAVRSLPGLSGSCSLGKETLRRNDI